LEYLEYKRLQRDHMEEKKLRYSIVFFAIASALLVVGGIMEMLFSSGSCPS
jgi:hypothetical protein